MTAPTEDVGATRTAPVPGADATATGGADATAVASPGAAIPAHRTSAGAPEPDGVFLELPEVPVKPGSRRSAWWRFGFPVALLLLVASVPVLVWAGLHVVLQSNDGRLINATTDPSKPGWEAAVEPTPTALLVTVEPGGQLSSVSLLALTGDGAGSVLFVPADTQAPGTTEPPTLVGAYAAGGVAGLKTAVEAVVGVDVGEVVVANDANWEELVAPVGSVTVANPDAVGAFAKGSIDLTPTQVGAYLRARNYGEDDTNRLLRQEAFWRAWLVKVGAAATPDAVPGEGDTGVARFIRTLAGDQVDFQVLPVRVQPRRDAYAGYFVPLPEAKGVVAAAVPFPVAAPAGSRPLLRVLDGTGELDHGLAAARSLAAAGAQIDGIGNASRFDRPTTQFIVSNPDRQAEAQTLRDALGVGEVVTSGDSTDSVDVTLILGADAVGLAATGSGGG